MKSRSPGIRFAMTGLRLPHACCPDVTLCNPGISRHPLRYGRATFTSCVLLGCNLVQSGDIPASASLLPGYVYHVYCPDVTPWNPGAPASALL
ncbi:hypothetical protein [Celerinatantimonas sp. YJH-8]|uniref:hypothetical protein n=1 Tax=Celerinatantimonas sp. YJH-8 TaxID=3228714 RepID=UPI0038C76A02